MIKTEWDNDCVGCETCIGCGRGNYLALTDLICDECGSSEERLFMVNGSQICIDCLLKDYETIDIDTYLDYV